ncbi:MAG: hypothetical protein ACRD0A_01890 [Acidimicrobiales bacterium]
MAQFVEDEELEDLVGARGADVDRGSGFAAKVPPGLAVAVTPRLVMGEVDAGERKVGLVEELERPLDDRARIVRNRRATVMRWPTMPERSARTASAIASVDAELM